MSSALAPSHPQPFADAGDRASPGCGMDPVPADLYQQLLARFGREHVPYAVTWELTHACNLRCVMCYNVALDRPALTTAECIDVLEQLADAGTLRLTLTGGEILTRSDFFVIAERARALGFALDLKTNGTLITPAVADRIAGLAPGRVDISLLGARPATFDAVAGGRNVYERVLRGVELLQERGVRVKLNTLLLALNVAEQQEMIDLALALGASHEQVFKVSPSDDGGLEGVGQQLSREQMADVLCADRTPFAPRQLSGGGRTCSVGLSSCLISPYGTVYPCIELRIPAGDLREQRFSEIWSEGAIFRELRARHTVGNLPDCRDCAISSYCEGRCAGLSFKEHGDLYGGHTLACRHAQARYAQQHPGLTPPGTPWLTRAASQDLPAACMWAPVAQVDA